MFTGIIEAVGEVVGLTTEGTNSHFCVHSALSNELKVDQSLSHDGVCLTVVNVEDGKHWVTAVRETLTRSTFGLRKQGDRINLERSMPANGRFDGHIVQGHVDQVATVTRIHADGGSWLFRFEYDPTSGHITVEKGSICVNGVSLTCFDSATNGFSVAIIPYTFHNTNFMSLKVGDRVNLEFDILGKYVERLLTKR